MASEEDLAKTLEATIKAGHRNELLNRGLARSLIWANGELPEGSPVFSKTLSDDLLDYGYGILTLSLQLREINKTHYLLRTAFLTAGESIESAVHRNAPSALEGYHRVSAAVSFHLAQYSARAFSLLPDLDNLLNLSLAERVIFDLLKRDFRKLFERTFANLLSPGTMDEKLILNLKENDSYILDDAIHELLQNSFLSAFALFNHALTTGAFTSSKEAIDRLFFVAKCAAEMGSAPYWWISTLAAHLLDDLWELSFYEQIPSTPPDKEPPFARWNELRQNYIERIFSSNKSAIELWPSQVDAARRSYDTADDLVVALPTSAGKTRIAELCILRTLSIDKRVIYVTPLRALSAQVERDLSEVFVPLGFNVSSLYGAAGIESVDTKALRDEKIVVSTPEKLDFALRNDPEIIDDVGLIVFDEGHMLGPGEREIRYETLVHRILRRSDSESRRIVCLSALFPSPEEMDDLVKWIRQDEAGVPIHSTWRPTRQRFGIISKTKRNEGRLDITLGSEKPFIPGFILPKNPPEKSRRRNPFPQHKDELTIATARQFVNQGKRVLVYCSLKGSVEKLGSLILTLLRQKVLEPFDSSNERIINAQRIGSEWLGDNHPAVKCLEVGVALHHGSLPRQFLTEIESLLKSGDCPLTIASPTLSQGLNLSASVLLVPSIWRNGDKIPVSEFANVIGRAGRAFVDIEGLVLHIAWDKKAKATRDWEKLIEKTRTAKLRSGILELSIKIFKQISATAQVGLNEVIDYVTGNSTAWTFQKAEDSDICEREWDTLLASFDSVILGAIPSSTSEDSLLEALTEALDKSLFLRQVTNMKNRSSADAILDFLAARAKEIWANTDQDQRRGFYSAGMGLRAGNFITLEYKNLILLLLGIEESIRGDMSDKCAGLTIKFAKSVFSIAPFIPFKGLPENWEETIKTWLNGGSSEETIEACEDGKGVEFIQDALSYRLPWAMEAIRAYGVTIGDETAELLEGLAPLALQTGTSNLNAMLLLRSGLTSREAAFIAIQHTEKSFSDKDAMKRWLRSDEIKTMSTDPLWPSPESHYAWVKFIDHNKRRSHKRWDRKNYWLDAFWKEYPADNQELILSNQQGENGNLIWDLNLNICGETIYSVDTEYLVRTRFDVSSNRLNLEYFGPDLP